LLDAGREGKARSARSIRGRTPFTCRLVNYNHSSGRARESLDPEPVNTFTYDTNDTD
jgi:hypothetical protein